LAYDDIPLDKKESFITLANICRHMCIKYILILEGKNILESLDNPIFKQHPLWESVDYLRRNKIEFVEIEREFNKYALDISFKAWKVIGYWTNVFNRIKNSKEGVKIKNKQMRDEVIEKFDALYRGEINVSSKGYKEAREVRKAIGKGKKAVPSLNTIVKYLQEEGRIIRP